MAPSRARGKWWGPSLVEVGAGRARIQSSSVSAIASDDRLNEDPDGNLLVLGQLPASVGDVHGPLLLALRAADKPPLTRGFIGGR